MLLFFFENNFIYLEFLGSNYRWFTRAYNGGKVWKVATIVAEGHVGGSILFDLALLCFIYESLMCFVCSNTTLHRIVGTVDIFPFLCFQCTHILKAKYHIW